MDKKTLRLLAKTARGTLTPEEQNVASQKLSLFLPLIPEYTFAKNIAFYLATQNEINVMPLIEKAWQEKKHVFLPAVLPNEKQLRFFLYEKNDSLSKNRFGILEPPHQKTILPEQLDIVFCPLLLIDKKRNRLGMGKGFYDFTFSFLKTEIKKPILIGVGYKSQQIEKIPTDAWDIAMDYFLCEDGVFK